MVKDSAGQLQETNWEDALIAVADKVHVCAHMWVKINCWGGQRGRVRERVRERERERGREGGRGRESELSEWEREGGRKREREKKQTNSGQNWHKERRRGKEGGREVYLTSPFSSFPFSCLVVMVTRWLALLVASQMWSLSLLSKTFSIVLAPRTSTQRRAFPQLGQALTWDQATYSTRESMELRWVNETVKKKKHGHPWEQRVNRAKFFSKQTFLAAL